MSNRTTHRLRGVLYPHRWVCPRCRNEFPEQKLRLTAIPTCNNAGRHTTCDMRPLGE